MAKQLNVNLAFTADTSKAKAQLQDLQNQLSQVINMPSSSFANGMTSNIQEATRAAAELKVHLQNATNVKTGSLDFTKLNQSIKNSGSSLSEYAAKLQSIGPEGQKAFTLLAQSVASAEVPIRRSNALLSELWVTMKNTARWQLTSSMLHGFMGAVQSAVGYTEDLNKSLNNIRIVTGNSVEQMADFAKEANKAAKALSTSTTNYTNAALIYYQQGLDEKQVKERADITVKMANASGQTAEIVSDQMTAIWNNFYDGSQSLEHYADAMTRLGADTASSSDEIAQGLEKFAAIGDMIGLSFDNAAAALATVTATTRQSADVVGTAFKTIFARIQGLSLGETLDDGTNLNKYSEALNKVGISIFEQNGELKDMDNILDEMGAKWKTLSKDQQVALAQTVAGVRQYNQLVALMDNYDFYEQNLTSAKNADGSLQAQADIYAESWEAASERVSAALEGLYDSLINDEAFIDLLNGIEKIISGVEVMVDSIGGFGGVITALGVIFTKVFRTQISESLTNASYGLMSWTKAGRQKIQQEKMDQVSLMLENKNIGETERQILQKQLESHQKLTDSARELTDLERQTVQLLLDQQKARGVLALQKEQELKKARNQEKDMRADLKYAVGAYGDGNNGKKKAFKAYEDALEEVRKKQKAFDAAAEGADKDKAFSELANARKTLESKRDHKYLKDYKKDFEEYEKVVIKTVRAQEEFDEALREATKEVDLSSYKTKENSNETEKNTQEKKENAQASKEMAEQEDATGQKVDETKQDIEEQTEALKKNEEQRKKLNSSQMAQNFVAGANAAMSAASAIQSVSSAMDTLQSDATPIEKITSVFMSLTMAASMGVNSIKGLDKIVLSNGKSLGQAAASTKLATKVLGKFGVTAQAAGGATAGSAIALGSLALYAGIAIAAIIAVTAIVKESIDAWNDDKLAVEGARKTVEQATESFNEAKTSLDNLSSSLKEYEKFQNAFEGLTEGTKEWNEALQASNAHISEMLRTYPELAQYFKNDNGKFSFTNTKAVTDLYTNRVNTANTSLNTAQIALNFAENRNAKTQALRSKDYADVYNGWDFAGTIAKYATAGMIAGGAIGLKGGAAVGTIAGPVGTGVGGAAGVAAGATTGALIGAATGLVAAINNNITASQESDKALDKLQAAYDKSGSVVFTSYEEFTAALDGISSTTIDALWKNRESLEKLAEETNLNTAQMQALIESNVSARNANNQYYNDLDNYDKSLTDTVVASRAAKALADPDSIEYKTQRKKAADKIFGGGFRADNYEEYLKARFGDDWQNYRVTDANGNDATLQKKNEKGTWENVGEKNTLSNTEVLDFMTSHYLQEVTDQDKTTIAQLQKVEDAIRSGSYNDQNQFDDYDEDNSKILQLQKDLASGGVASLLNFSPSEVKQIKASLNSIPEEYREAMEAAVEAYKPEDYANNVIAQEQRKIQDIFANAATELEMSDEALESYAASLMEADGQLKEFNEITSDAEEGSEEYRIETAELRAEHAKLMTAYAKASAAQYKLAKGLNKVQKAYEDNKDILEENNEASLDFHEAVGALSEALTEAFGMEVDASFVKDNLNLIKEACNGSEKALVQLRAQLNKDFIMSLGLETENAETALISELDRLSALALDADIGAELAIENEAAVTALNEALYTGKATIQDIEAMFNNANLAMPEYKTTEVPGEVAKSHSVVKGKFMGIPYTMESDMETTTMRTIPYFGDTPPTVDNDGNVTSYGGGKVSTTTTGDINQLDKILDYEGDDSNTSKGKEYKPEKDAYHEITKEIEKQERALKRLQKAKENAFGQNKLDAIDNEIESIKGLMTAHEELFRQQNEQLNIDAGKLLELFPEADITNGYIANYNDLLMKTTSEDQKKILDNYEKTWESMEQTQDDLIAFDQQIKDLNYDKISYQLELKVNINESELEQLDLMLKRYEDDFYKLAESVEILVEQEAIHETMLQNYKDTWDVLEEKFKNHDITQEKYIAGLQEARDGIQGQLEALIELDKQMMEYYENTLSAASDEIDDFTDHMEHLTGVFDHYMNLMEILGRSKDYDIMNNFLVGKSETLKDRLDTAQSYYDMLLKQKTSVEAKLNDAIARGDDAALELYKNEWDAIVDAVDEAQNEVLELTGEWAESMKAVVENQMEKIADTLEKTLTGSMGFEVLMDNFDKLNTQQEEYLTKTNQIYETNKLMRQAEQKLDLTNNKVAKQKLDNFINETKALQENTQLSKVELEIQQAKYDLLLAEIALEEAKNAKSTVRLTRNDEGNFGYVYTADENKVADAEQAVADADNKLYNLSLQKQQEYTEKYIQAQEQMFNELTQLNQDYLNGLISEEEFEIRKANIERYYYGSAEYNNALAELNRQYRDGEILSEDEYNRKKQELMEKYQGETGILTNYSNLYNIAVSGHAAATQDNWQKEYGKMTQNTSTWKEAVDQYLIDIQTQTTAWKGVSTTANETVKGALDNSAESTRILTEDSDTFKNKLINEVIPALGDELTAVSNVTTEFGNNRTALFDLIQEYDDYIDVLDEAIEKASKLSSMDTSYTPPAANIKPTTPTPSGTGTGTGAGTGAGAGKGSGTDTNDNNTETKPTVPTFKEERMDDIVTTPASKFNEGDRIKIADNNGFTYYYTKSGNTITQSTGPRVTLFGMEWMTKLGTVKSKFYNEADGRWYYQSSEYPNEWYNGWAIEKYDTGGYTGDWGPEGKLAMLHQKELVLNAQDTENVLGIIMAVREIMNSIDKQATWASSGLGMLTAAGYNSTSQNLEQTVTIHAEFPNATNHNEIEEAFNTLINRASQYANRK